MCLFFLGSAVNGNCTVGKAEKNVVAVLDPT